MIDFTPWEGRAVSLIFTARPVLDASGVRCIGSHWFRFGAIRFLRACLRTPGWGNRSSSSMIGIADPAGRTQ